MGDAAASVDLDLTVEQAWRAVTAWSRQGEWMPMTVVEVVEGDGGLGTVLEARTGPGPLAVVDRMRVDVFSPPHTAEVEHLGRIVTGRGVFRVEPLPRDRSRVTWVEQPVSGGMVARLGGAAAAPTRWMLGVALKRLRRVAADLGG